MSSPTEGFAGAGLWAKFDDACKRAEDEFEQAVKEAARERDRVINAPGQWQAGARVKAAAEARYSRKEQAAQDARDKKCKQAEEALLKGLGDREGDRGYR
jgi:hypothetical protein